MRLFWDAVNRAAGGQWKGIGGALGGLAGVLV